jgi:hypothetical protein
MMRLDYTYCRIGNTRKEDLRNTNTFFRFRLHTFNPWLFAALLLLPNLLKGQCNTLICNQNVELKLGDNCAGSVNSYYLIQNNWQCGGPTTVTYYAPNGVAIGNSATGDYLGQTLSFQLKHNWSGLTCWGTVYVTDKKKPVITVPNVTLNCTEDASATALAAPVVTDNCSSNVSVSHQDTMLDFGCGYTGFAGYFDPANWEVCLPTNTNGDGGVDVTGAPNSILVEGASHSPLSTNPRYVTRFKIVIPTEGYVSFDWSSFGGSSFNSDAFYLTINNWCVQLTTETTQNGTYTTGLLQPGDVLSFEQTSDGNSNHINTLVSNFHFSTLAWKVIKRKWTATDQSGNTSYLTQTVTIKRASLSNVVFPPNRDGIAAPMLPCGAMADLAQTGVPFIDEDGNLATTTDQYGIGNGDCTFNITHEDQLIPTCEGSGLTLRKWFIIDDCTGNLLEHTQLIKSFDVTPPVVTCPPPSTVSTNGLGCFSTLTLPPATATDDCSSTINIEPQWAFGTGFGPFDQVQRGTHPVTYRATDACGNTATCTTAITVEDEIAPVVICDAVTVASLDSDGTALLNAQSVDDGTYDWCCISAYDIKRLNASDNAYAPTLSISCGDLNSPVEVRLRVTDCAGNTGYCDVQVVVEDQLAPAITPPATLTVDCDTDLSNLSQFGEPLVFDNCSFTLTHTSIQQFNYCGQGTLTRTWTATDPGGNVSTVQQVIHIINVSPWNVNGNQIVWPQDYSLDGCGVSTEPYDLPPLYALPVLAASNGCESVNVGHEDEIFWISEPACYKIFRTWKVVDWCQYVPNSGSTTGLWEHVQVIEVTDTEAPVFINPPVNVIGTGAANGCTGAVTLPMPQVTDCSNHVFITVTGDLGAGFQYNNIASGIYQMTYAAMDGCGNTTEHHFTVTIGDNQPPVATCSPGISVMLDADGEVPVDAEAFNAGSYDACSPASGLLFCFSPDPADEERIFDCGNIGMNPITLYVMDPGGNMAQCQSALLVLNNPSVCNVAGPNLKAGGQILNHAGQPVGGVTVSLAGVAATPETTQPGAGNYLFENIATGSDLTISPVKNTFPLNGVTTFDLIKIGDHILAVDPFDFAWQVIAADANGNGTVTAADMVAIQSLILLATTNFPNGVPSWRFVPSDFVFNNLYDPFGHPETITLSDLSADMLDANFLAIKMGDVTGNADPSAFTAPMEDREQRTFIFETADRYFKAGEFVEVVFENKKDQPVAAWQGTLDFNPRQLAFIEMNDIDNPAGELVFFTGFADLGAVTALDYSNPPAHRFSVSFQALNDGLLSEALQFSSRYTEAAAWETSEEKQSLQLVFKSSAPATAFSEASPNPFSLRTSLGIQLEQAAEIRLTVCDATGKVVFDKIRGFTAGSQAFELFKEELPGNGVYFYHISTDDETKSGRLVVF